jgi:hypothetical protein
MFLQTDKLLPYLFYINFIYVLFDSYTLNKIQTLNIIVE